MKPSACALRNQRESLSPLAATSKMDEMLSMGTLTRGGSAVVVDNSGAAQRRSAVLLPLVAVLILILDQASKIWIRANLPPGEEIAVWPGVVHLSHVLNRGAAWGMLEGRRWLLIMITLVVLAGAVAMARSVARSGLLAKVGLGLIVGGAVGNLIDRVLFGTVTDMIDFDTAFAPLRNFPVFNVADSALTVGVCLLLCTALRRESAPEAKPLDAEPLG